MTDIAAALTDSALDTAGGNFTLSGQSLGAADATRVIVAAVSSRTAVTAATLDGNAMTQDDIDQFGSGTVYHSSFYRLPYPTGTTGDFAFTRASGSTSTLVAIYALTGPSSIAKGTMAAEGGNGDDGPQDIVNDIAAGGACLYVAAVGFTETTGWTWSNATQDAIQTDGANRVHIAAHLVSASLLSAHAEELNHVSWSGLTWILAGVEYTPVDAAGQPTSKRHGGIPSVALPGRGNVWAPALQPVFRPALQPVARPAFRRPMLVGPSRPLRMAA
jgi:hypothetical protein